MNDILKKIFGDQEGVLSESTQQTLTEAIDTHIADMVEEKLDLALEAQDKEHTGMLQTLVERYENKIKTQLKEQEDNIDETHAKVVQETFQKVDQTNTEKLNQVKDHYEGLLNESVANETTVLVEAIDTFLDKWLEENVPTEIVQEKVKRDRNAEILEKISTMVGINESVSEEVRLGMIDAKKTIDTQRDIINKLEKDSFLNESTKDLPVLERKFILESFSDDKYTLDHVKRNLDYIQKLYSKEDGVPTRVVQEETTSHNVDSEVIVESQQTPKSEGEVIHPAMAAWVKSAGNQSKFG